MNLTYNKVPQLEAQIKDLQEELAKQRTAFERLVDNTLFGAGAAPVFHPEDERFHPRDADEQKEANAVVRPPLSVAAWRRRKERLECEQADRDRQARLVEELKAIAAQRKQAAQ